MRGVGRDHVEVVVSQLGDRQVGLELAVVVEPLRVRDHARLGVDAVGGQPLELPPGVAALHRELGHERHVHQDHAVATGAMLSLPVRVPVLAAPGELACRGRLAWGQGTRRRVPVGAFPATDVAEERVLRHQPVVNRRQLRAARGPHRAAWVMRRIDHAERLDRAGGPVLRIGLIGVQPVDVHAGDVDVRPAIDDPVRDDAADAAAGQDADGVEAGRDEVVAELGSLAEHRRQVRREALRPAEELADPDFRRDRNPGHRLFQERAHPIPVRRQLAEGEVGRDPVDLPRRADRLEHAEHQAAAFFAEVAVVGRVLQHGQSLPTSAIGSVSR